MTKNIKKVQNEQKKQTPVSCSVEKVYCILTEQIH